MAALATIATVAAGAAAVVGAGAQIYGGYAQQQASDKAAAQTTAQYQAEALQLQEKGRAEFAASQRDAIERRLQGQIVLSQQQAAAAASGGGAGGDAPTIVRLMTETAQRGDYGAESALYQGRSQQSIYDKSAANDLVSAANPSKSNNFIGSLLDGVGTLLGGAGQVYNMADRYNILPKPAASSWGFNSSWVRA